MKPIVKQLVSQALDESSDINDYPEKFAKIFVKECYALIMDQAKLSLLDRDYRYVDGLQVAVELLEERFGD